ncbi:MAG: hypothetical protein D6800_07630 [Candidatus Zixiibacteriota bacterium]|nr:MAG: hypothetical protein D6800_07630 [candidate division Zixibacteria bacterium]
MARTKKSAPAKTDTTAASAKGKTKTTSQLSAAEARREYQRRYYQMHKEKAKEYQRQYNLTHKKKARCNKGKTAFTAPREVVRTTFNTSDLMHSPVEKTLKMLEKIIRGERMFTM